jgi:2-polyprenyl-3-methyl-5-hydroxy-6-metoxy-1,4-benzoquinol methylase
MKNTNASQSDNWENLGNLDPKYAIASRSDKKFNSWSDEEFFRIGQEIISNRLSVVTEKVRIDRRNALDFGCGIGRLTAALAGHFDRVVGIDVSQSMIQKARKEKKEIKNIDFYVEKNPDFDYGKFDFVIAHHVIQHVGTCREMKAYIRTLCRHTNGVLVFNIPVFIPFKNKIQLKRRIYSALNATGFGAEKLYALGLTPIRMNSLKRSEVRRIIQEEGLQIFLEEDVKYDTGQVSVTFYVTRFN